MEVFLPPKVPFEPITLCPIGDIQAGTPASDLDLLERDVERALREDACFIGMGDYIDLASPSNRSAIKGSRLYDTVHASLDDAAERTLESVFKILEPTRGRWVGMLQGHHYHEFQDGTTSDTRLCEALETRFLGDFAAVRLQFSDGGQDRVDCTIVAHHGTGSGSSMAYPITKLEKVIEWAEADVYLIGHHHKRVAANVPRLYLEEDRIVAKERVVLCTGSYLKGYMQDSRVGARPGGGYVEKALMRPVTLGGALITIFPERGQCRYEILT